MSRAAAARATLTPESMIINQSKITPPTKQSMKKTMKVDSGKGAATAGVNEARIAPL